MLLCPANRSNAVVTRRLFLFCLGRHREHADTSDDTDSSITDSESNSVDDKTELSSSDWEIGNTEATSTQAELSDEFDGFSSLFNEQESSDMVEDDASDSDDDQESSGYDSNSGDNNIALRLSDSESADENTEPAATEPVMSDDSVCQLLDGFPSLFNERGESDFDEDDELDSDDDQESSQDEYNYEENNIELRLSHSESADNNTEPTATEPELSVASERELLDGLSSLFNEHEESDLGDDDELCYQREEDERKSESEYGDFSDDDERTVGTLGETKRGDKQERIVQSTPKEGHWETAIKSLKIAAGVAGVGLALYAAYKYFR